LVRPLISSVISRNLCASITERRSQIGCYGKVSVEFDMKHLHKWSPEVAPGGVFRAYLAFNLHKVSIHHKVSSVKGISAVCCCAVKRDIGCWQTRGKRGGGR
jgi:hypothetical protein